MKDGEFRTAAASGNLDKLQALYQPQILNQPNSLTGETALHLAAKKGHINVCQWLIQQKANLNLVDKNGNTPLHLSISNGHVELAHCILEAKADVFIKNNQHMTVLNLCCASTDDKVKYLIKKIRDCIVEQTQVKQMMNPDIHGIDIRPNGDIIFLNKNQTVKAQQENKHKVMVQVTAGEAEATVNLSSENGVIDLKSQTDLYHVPPIILLMSHDNSFAFDLIIAHLPYLKALGYRTICFEYDQSLDFAQTAKIFKNTTQNREISEYNRKVAQLTLEKLTALVESGMNYQGVDADISPLREEKYNSMIHHFTPCRNKEIARNLVWAAERDKGGVIAFTGLVHVEISKIIQTMVGQKSSQFLLFETTKILDNIHNNEFINKMLELNLANGLSWHKLNENSPANKLEQQLKSPIEQHLQKRLKDTQHIKPFVKKIQNSAVLQLNDIIMGFSGRLNYNLEFAADASFDAVLEATLDATLAVHSVDEYVQAAMLLSTKTTMCPQLAVYQNKANTQSAAQPCLAYENVNDLNKMIIKK